MTKFYNRRWSIDIDGKPLIEATDGIQFKIAFTITVDFGAYISYADIAIYNLSQDTISKILKKNSTILLKAGYVDSIDSIFQGRIKNVLKERNGPNTIIRLLGKSGSQPKTQVNKSLGKGSTIVDAIKTCVSAMGYPIDITESDFSNEPVFLRGFSLFGDAEKKMDMLANSHNFKYVIEKERIVIIKNSSYRKGSPLVIDKFNGMEGIPEITEVGCDVSLRLSPTIRVGGRIDIQSELSTFNFNNLYFQDIPSHAGKGIYRIFKVVHSGDSWGDAWTTRITGYR